MSDVPSPKEFWDSPETRNITGREMLRLYSNMMLAAAVEVAQAEWTEQPTTDVERARNDTIRRAVIRIQNLQREPDA